MIDLHNKSFTKVELLLADEYNKLICGLLVSGEVSKYIGRNVNSVNAEEYYVFTNKRIIIIQSKDVRNIIYRPYTGNNHTFTSLPYRNIQAYSFDTCKNDDELRTLELLFFGFGNIKFEFYHANKLDEFFASITEYIV